MTVHTDIVSQIAIAIVTATLFAFVARLLRQPLILAYIAAGIVVGPTEGLGWVHEIEPVSELGLILLLYMIGLEIDLKKIRQSGRELIAVGTGQFVICLVLGLLILPHLGFAETGRFGPLYLAVAAALSSTMIVVKMLYDKYELDTIPGRVTLGILVFQDIWAILFLALQHDLNSPQVSLIMISLFKGVGLVAITLGLSRFVLPYLFRWIAKVPELLLIAALGWCFGVTMLASTLGLSREMGALIAGIALSAFPYNLDVVAKIISLRDFFITLFFVSLGAQIPRPTAALIQGALALSAFLIVSRFLSISPILHFLKMGNRVSLVPAINLAQISEFSLVICALGVSAGHIGQDVLSVVVLTFVTTSVLATYAIQHNHALFMVMNPWLRKLGFHDLQDNEEEGLLPEGKPIFFLGFSRYASSLLHQLLEQDPTLAMRIGVVDFNPQVRTELDRRGIYNVYGDISHQDTLHHANVASARILICSLPDSILKGTTNERLLRQLKTLAPHAAIIMTAEFFYTARALYKEGADFVFVPRLMSVRELAEIVFAALEGRLEEVRARENAEIERREQNEVLP